MRHMKQAPTFSAMRLVRCVVPLLAALDLTTAAAAEGSVMMGKGADITSMCGSKPMVVGLSDGYGGDTWRRITQAEIQDELSRCPNVKKFIYTNANGNQQKANSDINSLVAQGVNVLLVFPDFGAAQLPAMRAAMKAGVTVVPYLAILGGTAGKDYTANVYQDMFRIGQSWADWYGKNLKTGNVLFMGGTPGATSSQNFLDGFKAGLKKYPGLKLVEDSYIVTNWNAVDAQKAVTGLLAKHSKIDGIATDYGVTTLATVKAFEQAGLPVPPLATVASNNELNCKYLARKKAGKGFDYFTLDGSTTAVRFALRRGVAAYQGTKNPEPLSVMAFPYADSSAGLDPKCADGAPPDADLSSILPSDKLQAIFKN